MFFACVARRRTEGGGTLRPALFRPLIAQWKNRLCLLLLELARSAYFNDIHAVTRLFHLGKEGHKWLCGHLKSLTQSYCSADIVKKKKSYERKVTFCLQRTCTVGPLPRFMLRVMSLEHRRRGDFSFAFKWTQTERQTLSRTASQRRNKNERVPLWQRVARSASLYTATTQTPPHRLSLFFFVWVALLFFSVFSRTCLRCSR